jgi:hypothetical protein
MCGYGLFFCQLRFPKHSVMVFFMLCTTAKFLGLRDYFLSLARYDLESINILMIEANHRQRTNVFEIHFSPAFCEEAIYLLIANSEFCSATIVVKSRSAAR